MFGNIYFLEDDDNYKLENILSMHLKEYLKEVLSKYTVLKRLDNLSGRKELEFDIYGNIRHIDKQTRQYTFVAA